VEQNESQTGGDVVVIHQCKKEKIDTATFDIKCQSDEDCSDMEQHYNTECESDEDCSVLEQHYVGEYYLEQLLNNL